MTIGVSTAVWKVTPMVKPHESCKRWPHWAVQVQLRPCCKAGNAQALTEAAGLDFATGAPCAAGPPSSLAAKGSSSEELAMGALAHAEVVSWDRVSEGAPALVDFCARSIFAGPVCPQKQAGQGARALPALPVWAIDTCTYRCLTLRSHQRLPVASVSRGLHHHLHCS